MQRKKSQKPQELVFFSLVQSKQTSWKEKLEGEAENQGTQQTQLK